MNQESVPNELHIESLLFHKGAPLFRAINHPSRQEMLKLLHQNKRMTVTELCTKPGLEQSIASQQLAILRKPQIVKTERQGKNIFYSVGYKRIEEINHYASQLV